MAIADNLDKAYINFDPFQPLPGDSEFYVGRKNNPLDRMGRALLRENPRPPKFLFSGHRGSGKSTELNKLMADTKIQDKYFIVHYSIKEVLDVAGLDYTDLLLSIGAQIFIKATDDGRVKLRKGLLDELNRWRSTVEKEIVIEEGDIRATPEGREFMIKPSYDPNTDEFLQPLFEERYCMSFENYPVEMERIEQPDIHDCIVSE